jgi:carboxypeptidase D
MIRWASVSAHHTAFHFQLAKLTLPAGYNNGKIYFDREDVKAAIHAPSNVKWSLCGERRSVFNRHDPPGPEGEGDADPDPIQTVLPQVCSRRTAVLMTVH